MGNGQFYPKGDSLFLVVKLLQQDPSDKTWPLFFLEISYIFSLAHLLSLPESSHPHTECTEQPHSLSWDVD